MKKVVTQTGSLLIISIRVINYFWNDKVNVYPNSFWFSGIGKRIFDMSFMICLGKFPPVFSDSVLICDFGFFSFPLNYSQIPWKYEIFCELKRIVVWNHLKETIQSNQMSNMPNTLSMIPTLMPYSNFIKWHLFMATGTIDDQYC